MAGQQTISSTQLCVFQVPGLQDHTLALTLPEVLAIGSLGEPEPVLFSPPYLLGLSLWQDQLVTVIDLGAALLGERARRDRAIEQAHYLIGQTLWGSHREIVAWPILEGADTCMVLLRDVRLGQEPTLSSRLVYSTIHTMDQAYVLINTAGFLHTQTGLS